ncbi:MAG: hypothetical protein IJ997_02170 [Mycoplasmataceae bacterium]|nr:hypothetical protein [Mycoplasmataceae bacterium]
MYLLYLSNNKIIYDDLDNNIYHYYNNNQIYNLIMPENKVSIIYKDNTTAVTMSLVTFEMVLNGSVYESIYEKIYNPQFNFYIQSTTNPNGNKYYFYITNNETRSSLLTNQSYTYNYMQYYCCSYLYSYKGEVINCKIDLDTTNSLYLNNSKVFCTCYVPNQ